MHANNPCFVLRNHIAQQAIEAAEKGDYSEVERVMTAGRSPFTELPGYEAYYKPPPQWACELCVT